jgi:hypothetical protein
MKVTEREEPDLVFVQEPYEYQNRPAGIAKKYRIFTVGNGKPRATIVIKNNKIHWNLDLSFLQRLFSRVYCSPFLVPNEVPYK